MWIVYLKELRSLLRDRKTLIFTILIPIIAMPLIGFGMTQVMSKLSEKARTQQIKYAIFGAQTAPALAELFARDAGYREVKLDSAGDIRGAIGDDRIKLALNVPAQFAGASFAPQLAGKAPAKPWRTSLLYEYYWEYNYPQTPTTFALRLSPLGRSRA